jgi:hypothetical protein
VNLHLHDYRINFEDPPLWKYWAALPNGAASIAFNDKDPAWLAMSDDVYRGWELANRTLFQTSGNDGGAFVNRSRFMMVLLGCLLGVVLTAWAWQLGGPVAAMIAAGLFALDPNLLAHSALIKNDVALGLLMMALFHACWRAGRAMTFASATAIAMLMAIALNTKFSAILLAPMLVAVFAIRAAMPTPWMAFGRSLNSVMARAVASAGLLLAVAGVSVFGIWASYGFRFSPAPDPAVTLNTHRYALEAAQYRFQAEHPQPPLPALDTTKPLGQLLDDLDSELSRYRGLLDDALRALANSALSPNARETVSSSLAELQQFHRQSVAALDQARKTPEQITRDLARSARISVLNRQYTLRMIRYEEQVGDTAPDGFALVVNALLERQLLPSAWLHGVLFVHARSMVRTSYLLGETSATGWWYYFPLALLFKTPVGTILVLFVSFVLGLKGLARQNGRGFASLWTVACIALPVAIHLGYAMGSNLNIGLRHVLPVYPFMYLAAGAIVAKTLARATRRVVILAGLLGLSIAIETLAAFPNYIAFFNTPASRASHQGLDLLADSNLDWGQDLPLLAEWQRQHPATRLAFGPEMHLGAPSGSYFGTVDPKYYGIKADPLYLDRPNAEGMGGTHVLAISATYVQGVYGGPFAGLRDQTPLAVLGGSIYLYNLGSK